MDSELIIFTVTQNILLQGDEYGRHHGELFVECCTEYYVLRLSWLVEPACNGRFDGEQHGE